MKLEAGNGMKRVEKRWRGGVRRQVEDKKVEEKQVEETQMEGMWRGGGKGEVDVKHVDSTQVIEGRGKGVGVKVVEAKLRGRILVKPREQMWMLQKVKVDSPLHPFQSQRLICCRGEPNYKQIDSRRGRGGSTRANLAMSNGAQ